MKRLLVVLAFPILAFAQNPADNDPIGRFLFPPELVMENARQLSLTEKQRAALKAEVQKTQAVFLDAQWDLQEETSRMTELLQQRPVDEAAVLQQADKIMALERQIKRAHLGLLVRIRNLLTPEQLAKLEETRRGK